MSRMHNFSAGPGYLPERVIEETRDALWELEGCGQGLVETSHRGAAFETVIARARTRLRRLLQLDDDQEVLFLHGGARSQFYQVPMNLLRGGRAAYLDTGAWSKYAIADAQRFGTADVVWSSRAEGYKNVPRPGSWDALHPDTRYLHYTSNNTIMGSEYDYVPDAGDAWLVCDASSNVLSRPIEGSKFDLLYAGAQKNLGASGVTLVVIRKELVEASDPNLPEMLRYGVHVAKDSMHNTPCTFAIYVMERMCAWLEDEGGPEVLAARNDAQAAAIYAAIDATDFWKGRVSPESRSRMNIAFSTGDAALDTTFVKASTDAGLLGLKGHRSVGGLRASVYNAQTDEAVAELVAFMADFERRHG